MDKHDIEARIAAGREFTKCNMDVEGYFSDQYQKKPQPPLAKAPMRGSEASIKLPHDFSDLAPAVDYASLVASRKTRRVYCSEGITLKELSFMLWASQGVKSIRGKNYATLRTVPSGGARHAFEAYVMANNVKGLARGAYHYLPMTHTLELLHEVEDFPSTVTAMLDGQSFGGKADAVLFFSMEAYRAEWRYGIYAHRIAMVDLGHVGQALYMACEAMGIGTCGIGAFTQALCDEEFELDGCEEYTVYAQPVGRSRPEDASKELEFYAFLDEE